MTQQNQERTPTKNSLCLNDRVYTGEIILEIIEHQMDKIRCLSNLNPDPEYILLSSKVRVFIEKYFYEQGCLATDFQGKSVHPLQSLYGLTPLTDRNLPDHLIQVVCPIQ